MRVGKAESDRSEVNVGVCVMSPWLFNMYRDAVVKEIVC